jgi:hemerythrin-like metal-binding protein
MNLLQWKPEYSVGVQSMDDEHREMIDLINATYEKLSSNADADQVEEYLGEILSTISMHFALEERIMQNAGYGEFQEHKDDHEVLLDRLRDLMDDYFSDPVSGARRLEQSLSDWFAEHFSTFDARLHGELDA